MSEEGHNRLGIVSWIVLGTLAVVPGVFASGFTQFEFLKETIFYVLGGAALLAWATAVLAGRKISMTGGRIVTVFISFAMFALLATAWAPSTGLAMVSASNWIAAAALLLVVTSPVGRPMRLADVSLAVAVGTIAAAVLGLLDLGGVSLTREIWDAPGSPGPFDSRELAVGYYATALPLLAAAVFRHDAMPKRVLVGAALLLGAVHLGLCAEPLTLGVTGGAMVAAALIITVFQGLPRIAFAYGTLGALGVALLIAAGLTFGGPAAGPANEATALPWVAEMHPQTQTGSDLRDPRFAIPRIEEAPNWHARSYAIGVAFDLFRDEPIIGHGPAGWWAMQTKYPRPDEPYVQGLQNRYPALRAPHNGLALVMTELGGVGLFLLLAWLSGLLGITITALAAKAEPEKWLIEHVGLFTSLAGGVGAAIFTPSLQLAASASLLAVVAGLLVRESAALNDFRGMSSVWTINKTGRRWDTTLFCGIGGVVIALVLAGTGVIWGTTSYYRSWGDLAMYRTQHELAIDKYTLADDIFGGDGELLLNLALAHQRLGKVQEAVEDVDRAATLREFDVRIINLIAKLHLQKRKYADAVTASRRAVALFPNYIEGRRTLAAALNLQGRMNDSAAELQVLLELEPPDEVRGQVHRELGEYYQGPLDNPGKAVEHFEKALDLMEGNNFMRGKVSENLELMKKEVERRRLQREGKPIPEELMPQKPDDGHGHHGHDH